MTKSRQGVTHTANRIKFSRMNDRDPAADLIAVITLELHLLETIPSSIDLIITPSQSPDDTMEFLVFGAELIEGVAAASMPLLLHPR
jgi:hypothetical protein